MCFSWLGQGFPNSSCSRQCYILLQSRVYGCPHWCYESLWCSHRRKYFDPTCSHSLTQSQGYRLIVNEYKPDIHSQLIHNLGRLPIGAARADPSRNVMQLLQPLAPSRSRGNNNNYVDISRITSGLDVRTTVSSTSFIRPQKPNINDRLCWETFPIVLTKQVSRPCSIRHLMADTTSCIFELILATTAMLAMRSSTSLLQTTSLPLRLHELVRDRISSSPIRLPRSLMLVCYHSSTVLEFCWHHSSHSRSRLFGPEIQKLFSHVWARRVPTTGEHWISVDIWRSNKL